MAMWLRARDPRQFQEQHSRVRILVEHLMMRFVRSPQAFACVSANWHKRHRDCE
jgi:hypothetical protein